MRNFSVEQSLIKAKSHENKGELVEAQKLYQTILKNFSNNVRAQIGLAALNKYNFKQINIQGSVNQLVNLFHQGQFYSVVEQAKIILDNYPQAFVIWNILGASKAKIGELDEAIQFYYKAISLKPDFAEAYFNMGYALKNQGKLDQAIEAYNKCISIKPDYAQAYNNKGNALKEQGKLEEAIENYNKTLAFKSDHVDAHFNIGNALKIQGKLGEAIKFYNKSISLKPDYADAYYNVGNILRDQGKLDDAIKAYQNTISINTNYAEAYYNMGLTLKDQGKLGEAVKSYKIFISLKPDYAETYNNLGNIFQDLGKYKESIEAFKKALSLKPDYAEAYSNMGIVLKDKGKLAEAIEAHKIAISLKPDYAEAYNNMGLALKGQEKLKEAIEAYNQALFLKPNYAAAWVNGAVAFEQWNKLEQLEVWLDKAYQALETAPSDIKILKAKLLWRNKDFEASSNLIFDIDFETISKIQKRSYLELKAKFYEKQKDFDKAYECFSEGNLLSKNSNDYVKCDAENFFHTIKDQLTKLKSKSIKASVISSKEKISFNPVFLVGFPRSGTTLLDTILRSHSRIEVVEEQSMVANAKNFFHTKGYNGLLTKKLPAKLLAEAREVYKLEFEKHIKGFNSSSVYIDKLPLNLLKVALIKQLYPQANFILALRHPMDTIFSCWIQNFKLNPAMANMVDLDRIVDFYCMAMEIFKICRVKYNLNVHEIRYEDLLDDLSEETSSLLKFLNLNWETQMQNYRETAFKRGLINTPSYSQVVQPIYKDAKYRWLKYRKYLNKYLKQVDPWIKEFGYSKY